MSLETDLYALLSGVCPRVYPDYAPNDPTYPYIIWQQVGGRTLWTISNTVPDKRHAMMQIDVWSKTRLEANTISLAVESAMIQSSAFIARPTSALIATEDDAGELRGASQDFSIWAAR